MSPRENEDVKEFDLGLAEGKRKSFRNVKHYKRRKQWLAQVAAAAVLAGLVSASRVYPTCATQ